MPTMEILGLFALVLLGWYWHDSVRARDAGKAASRSACARNDYQFLDDTVVLHSIRPVRDDYGRLLLRRIYAFEYSDNGDNRRRGNVTLFGDEVVNVYVGPVAVVNEPDVLDTPWRH